MANTNAEILHHFYCLLAEVNFHQEDEDLDHGSSLSGDAFIQKHLRQIKLLSAHYKSQQNKSRYQEVIRELKRLKDLGADELKKLLTPDQQYQFQPMFSKFEDLSKKDEASILEDKELLQLLRILKVNQDNPVNE
jgi:isopropylmalate/homocitrate/citramalate synthase